jgi:hypothetical protein
MDYTTMSDTERVPQYGHTLRRASHAAELELVTVMLRKLNS